MFVTMQWSNFQGNLHTRISDKRGLQSRDHQLLSDDSFRQSEKRHPPKSTSLWKSQSGVQTHLFWKLNVNHILTWIKEMVTFRATKQFVDRRSILSFTLPGWTKDFWGVILDPNFSFKVIVSHILVEVCCHLTPSFLKSWIHFWFFHSIKCYFWFFP